ncbi:hypothetical protein JI666_09105 [Bacillus sp. NTK071]|uniref:hypothetical protein n=1 Tax=Bacillus sp. NTK071 TaxID=2802175 RepID=UPI001A8E809B|nr:hypothetical protein [Bacillus sp. NTK071]MBN8208901.1 hypothetical protein [Bacillus sp. NTK071]
MGNEKPITDPEKVSAEDLPDTRAMQDEFTRSFLKSTEEVEEGYYLFVSGIDRYEMYLPITSIIDERGYSTNKGFEQLAIGIEHSSYNIGITIEYISHLKKDNLETNLSLLGSITENIDFKKVNQGINDLYYGNFIREEDFGFIAYVQNTKDTGGILISYYIECIESDVSCEDKSKEDEFLKWLKSFKLKEENTEDEI